MATSKSISASSNATSDGDTFDASCIDALIQCKADNDGTPASGDTVDFYALMTLGDPDGAGADEYATVGHAEFLCQIDTNTEDPGEKVVNCPVGKAIKIYAVNNSSGRAITVSACVWQIIRDADPSELQINWT